MKMKNIVGLSGEFKSIQIHPSRLCNLSCLHCYSSSSPKARGALDAALLSEALSNAADEGYNYVSVSGGEPLLYQPLGQLLKHAHDIGYKTAIATNGMLLDEKHIAMLEGVTDLIAVSLDGIPEAHNKIRNSEKAFEKMASNLEHLRLSKIPFGFIFTLTQYNLHELDWVVNFALEQGAELLQIHPLENNGAAVNNLFDEFPDRKESAYAYYYSQVISQQIKEELVIQIDYANKSLVKKQPGLVYAFDPKPDKDAQLSDCLSRLAIEPDGAIVPIQYGFSRKYVLGDIHKSGFKQMSEDWKLNKMDDFYRLCEQVYQDIIDKSKPFVFNWNEIITKASNCEVEIDIPLRYGTANTA